MKKTNPDSPEVSKWELTPTPVERLAPASEKAEKAGKAVKASKADASEKLSKAAATVSDSIIKGTEEARAESDINPSAPSVAETVELKDQSVVSDDAEREIKDPKDIRKKKIIHELLDWGKTILIGVAVGVLLVIFVIQRDNVYGPSMQPTLYNGDVVFTEKISTYFDKYDRGDVVILDGSGMTGYDKDEYLIKRIVGMPGETVRIADGHVYIRKPDETDFYMLEESYLAEGTQTTVMAYGVEQGYDEITLGDDEYYCMGDNRPVSNDSRNLGPFDEDRIKGVAIMIVYPFSSFKIL